MIFKNPFFFLLLDSLPFLVVVVAAGVVAVDPSAAGVVDAGSPAVAALPSAP
jgi:hypothetical protein